MELIIPRLEESLDEGQIVDALQNYAEMQALDREFYE